jgi:hypothetical protein
MPANPWLSSGVKECVPHRTLANPCIQVYKLRPEETRMHDGAAASRAMQLHLRTVFAAIDRIAEKHGEFFEQPTETE